MGQMPRLKTDFKFYKTLPRTVKFILAEGWPIIILLFALAIELSHIEHSGWLHYFLYDADSLTLPLLRESIAQKQPAQWVFSSDFGLFPEGIFYAISSFFTSTISMSLVFNAALSMTTIYVLLRWAASNFNKAAKYMQRLFALGCSLLFIFYMLLERLPYVDSRSIATLYLLTTYYYGVVISGAFLLCISLVQFKTALSDRQLKKWLLTGLAFAVAALSSFSDPLFVIEYVVPLVIVLVLLLLLGGLTFKRTLYIGLPQLLGAGVGYLVNSQFKEFIGQAIGGHIITQQIPSTLTIFHYSVSVAIHSKSGLLELLLVTAVILFSAFYSLWWIYTKSHHSERKLDGRLLMLSLFAVIEPVIIVFFSVAIGSTVTRYLLPLVILPMFGLMPLLSSKVSLDLDAKLRNVNYVITAAVVVLVLVLGSLSFSSVSKLISPYTYPDVACLSKTLGEQEAYGVGEYWLVRPLDVYGPADEQAVQVNTNFSIYPWQANVGSYNRTYSFIIVDAQPTSLQAITASDPYLPPGPSKITNCSNMYIYQYSVNSLGYVQLNSDVHTSYKYVMKLRAEGDIAKYLAACTFILPDVKVSPLCAT